MKGRTNNAAESLYAFDKDSLADYVCSKRTLYPLSPSAAFARTTKCDRLLLFCTGVAFCYSAAFLPFYAKNYHESLDITNTTADGFLDDDSRAVSIFSFSTHAMGSLVSILKMMFILYKSDLLHALYNRCAYTQENLLEEIRNELSPELLTEFLKKKATNGAQEEESIDIVDAAAAVPIEVEMRDIVADPLLYDLQDIFIPSSTKHSVLKLVERTLLEIEKQDLSSSEKMQIYKHLAGDLSPEKFVQELYNINTQCHLRSMFPELKDTLEAIQAGAHFPDEPELGPNFDTMINQVARELVYMKPDEEGNLQAPSNEHAESYNQVLTMMQKLQKGEKLKEVETRYNTEEAQESVAGSSGRNSPAIVKNSNEDEDYPYGNDNEPAAAAPAGWIPYVQRSRSNSPFGQGV